MQSLMNRLLVAWVAVSAPVAAQNWNAEQQAIWKIITVIGGDDPGSRT